MPICPDHNVEMVSGFKEIRTGYHEVLRKLMKLFTCPVEGCGKWCEDRSNYIMWP